MDIDIKQIAVELIRELEAESLLQKMKAEGVRLLYETIRNKAETSGTEDGKSSESLGEKES